MPTFELEANGKSYEIEAPDQATAVNAFKGMNSGNGSAYDQAADIVKGFGGGLVRGAAGTVGMVTDTIPSGINFLANTAERLARGETSEQMQQRVAERRAHVMFPGVADAISTKGIQSGIEQVTGPAYVPHTRAGKFASTAGEFVPGAMIGGLPNMARNAVAYGIVPGLVSEGAGQVFEGGAMEGPARIAGGLVGGLASAGALRNGTAAGILGKNLGDVTPQQIDAAEQLFQRAAQAGQPISRAEALQAVTNGRSGVGDLQHTVEGMGGMKPFYAERPAQNEAAARQAFDGFGAAPTNPADLGPSVSNVAQQAMRESPEGRILADSLFRAGPRVTPEQAGNVMQQELRGVYDRREGMRSALADQDYTAARGAGTPVPTNSVVRFIDRELQSAKGDTQRALLSARQAMFRPDGSLDTSVAGLHNARGAISDLIDTATRSGANNTARELGGTLSRLDDALESVPAYGQARRNFRAASQQLEPFEQSRVPGQIIERDQYGRRNVMPADRVPQTVQQGGPSAARDFNSVATPEAREAFEQNIITQVLDKANKKGADLSADSIRQALRQNEDVLRQYPGVRDRLESIAIARDGLARVEQLPIGKLAKRDLTTKKAVNALFPENPLPNSQNEIASTMEELARRSPAMARQLVRTHAELTFNEATQRMASGGFNQSGGAKFAAVLRGNPQQAANLEAAVRALPDGDTTWLGFNAFLENLEAQRFRQATGSRTAFKIPGVEDLKSGGILNNAAQTVGGGGMKIPQKVMNGIQNWNVGRNLDDLARLLTDPAAAREFRAIATAPRGSSKALALTTRLAFVAFNSRKSEGNPTHVVVPVGQNLR